MLSVTFLDVKGGPTNTVSFLDWKVNPEVSAEKFKFTPPADAKKIEFRKIQPATPKQPA